MEKLIPVLETERLILRPHALKDFPTSVALWADSDVTRYTIGKASSEQRTWMRMLTYRGLWSLLNYGYWAIEEKSTGEMIGEMGFADFKREIEAPHSTILHDKPELGWVISPQSKGKGYATEGVQAVLSWGESHFDSKNFACIINPLNVASIRVARKCGFQEFTRVRMNGEWLILLNRLRK